MSIRRRVPRPSPGAMPCSIHWASHWAPAWLLVAGFLLASVSVAPQPARADDAKAEAEQLRARVVELRRELVMRDLEIQRLAEELAELRAQLGTGTASERPGSMAERPVSRAEPPTTIRDDVEIPGLGGVEETELEEPTPGPPAPEVRTESGGTTAPGAQSGSFEPTVPAIAGSGGEELYDQGYALFHQQKYPESERAFRLFLSRFPTSDLADNALFWIGESRWARGDFAAALESYTTTVEQYPDGNKVPDALLKAGRCLENLGQTSRAVRTFEEVVLRFAGSAAAITAQERLDELK